MEGRGAMWLVFGPLIALKVWATILLLMYAPTKQAIVLTLGTGWPWVLLVLALVAAPTIAWWRLVKVRRRREQLRRSEWMLDAPPRTASTFGTPRPTTRRVNDGPSTQWPVWERRASSRRDRES